MEKRGDGELELASVRVGGGGILGFGAGNWRESEGIGMLGFPWC